MIPGIVLVLAVAVVDWFAVTKGWRKVEILAKPATLLALFLGVMLPGWLVTEFSSPTLVLFGIGLLFCLAGDIFLLLSERFFLAGLVAFLLGHVFYIIGFNLPLPEVSPLWGIALALVLGLGSSRLLRRIVAGVRAQGKGRLALPVAIYGLVITLMLLSAMLTIYNQAWSTASAGLVTLGAALFYLSDALLAWNKFVAPVRNGRLYNMIAYHLGQVALVAGVVLQFTG